MTRPRLYRLVKGLPELINYSNGDLLIDAEANCYRVVEHTREDGRVTLKPKLIMQGRFLLRTPDNFAELTGEVWDGSIEFMRSNPKCVELTKKIVTRAEKTKHEASISGEGNS